MKRVLFITNYPSPYRVTFFDKLGQHMQVTVLFHNTVEKDTHRNARWFVPGEGGFSQVHLEKKIGGACLDVLDWVRKPFDAIVVGGYSDPTMILAMTYMRLHRIPFYMEVDGGLIREESRAKYLLKKTLVSMADEWLSTGKHTTQYLVHYGAKENNVRFYPFSSLNEADILPAVVSREEKGAMRQALGISEKRMVLSVGQFIHRKGFDVLLRAAQKLDADTGVYIVGGEPTEEYLQLRDLLGLKNVHFVGFMKKETLTKYYLAADVFVLPTREDIWGLVINEALGYGLPVITTDKCVAGLELVEDGVNGYIVPVEDEALLAEKMGLVLSADTEKMGAASLEKIRPYTIENMVAAHVDILKNGR